MKTIQSNSKDKRSYQSQYSVEVGYTPKRSPQNLATSCMPIAAYEPLEIPAAESSAWPTSLMLEQLLGTGQFASASELARCIGIQKHLLSALLALLNMPVPEIEKWLFETY